MNWEETIIYARKTDEYKRLVEQAYLGENLKENVEAFRSSVEFTETISQINKFLIKKPGEKIKLFDRGAGNGISTMAFALNGFSVVAVEPDSSNTVGALAIKKLKEEYNLSDVEIDAAYGAVSYTHLDVYKRQV